MDDPARRRPLTAVSGRRTPIVSDGLDATLVLLRHGESTAIVEGRFQGQSDVPLSPLGLRQAEMAAVRLARPHRSPALPVPLGAPVEIVHSPLARAARTAAAVHEAAKDAAGFDRAIPLRAEPGLSEIAQGEWEGRLATEIADRWSDTLSTWRVQPTEAHAPGGEALDAVQARLRPAVDGVLARLADRGPDGASPSRTGSQVLGSGDAPGEHPWTIVVAHDGVFKVLMLTLLDLPLDRFWLWPFALCGISVVELANGRPRLRAHNLTEHLAPLLEERARAQAEERERAGAL